MSSAILAALRVRLFFCEPYPNTRIRQEYSCAHVSMSVIPLSKSEIVAELQEIQAERQKYADAIKRLEDRETELLTLLQNPKKATRKHVPLTFGKNVITWDNEALAIKGKGYKFVKALYEARKMRLKEATLDRLVWNNELSSHDAFKEYMRWLATKLEKAKFPYRLIPVKSKGQIKSFLNPDSDAGKPLQKWIEPGIIGAKLATK